MAIPDGLYLHRVIAVYPFNAPVQLPEQAVLRTDKTGSDALAGQAVALLQPIGEQ